ncbi:MAG: PEP-CTERM sorting domain-containing protein [Aquabacterium sp.]
MQALRHTAVIAAALLITATAQAASVVVNGSLNGQTENNAVPVGWTILQGTPDLMDALDNVGLPNTTRFGAAPKASPDGGTWVGLGADTGLVERFGQVLNGLTVGQEYTVSWLAGNFGYDGGRIQYLGANAIDVLINGVSVGQGAKLALGSDWYSQSVSFVATGASQQLSFKLATADKAYMSIDGIAVQAVPEPATWMLMGISLAGLAVVTRRGQRTVG